MSIKGLKMCSKFGKIFKVCLTIWDIIYERVKVVFMKTLILYMKKKANVKLIISNQIVDMKKQRNSLLQ